MIVVIGNFAGVFSNIIKLLCWSIKLDKGDKLLFYYTNKADNNSPHIPPFQDYQKDISRIFFYKYIQFPEDCTLDTFMKVNKFDLGFPEIQKEALPPFLQNYSNGFIPCSAALYKDPHFPQIREFYNYHLKKQLRFTPLMSSFLEKDLSIIQGIQRQGKRVLAVFIRWTKHFGSYDPNELFREVKDVIDQYDYILPITQIGPFFQETVRLFGDKCIQFERKYLDGNVDWCRPMSDDEYEDEFRCAIRDVYLASQCDFVLGGSSNLFLGALLWNTNVPFKVFDELSNKNGG